MLICIFMHIIIWSVLQKIFINGPFQFNLSIKVAMLNWLAPFRMERNTRYCGCDWAASASPSRSRLDRRSWSTTRGSAWRMIRKPEATFFPSGRFRKRMRPGKVYGRPQIFSRGEGKSPLAPPPFRTPMVKCLFLNYKGIVYQTSFGFGNCRFCFSILTLKDSNKSSWFLEKLNQW